MPHLSDLNPTLHNQAGIAWERTQDPSDGTDAHNLGATALNPFANLDTAVTKAKKSGEFAMDGLTAIDDPETCAQFKEYFETYEQIFAGAGITMPTPEELAAAGIDWARLVELKEDHPNHELVVAPLTIDKDDLRQMIAGVVNDKTIPNNPLKRCKWTRANSDGLWLDEEVVDNWRTIMANTAKEWRLQKTSGKNDAMAWTAFLLPGQGHNASYEQIKLQNLTTVTIAGYFAYQMKLLIKQNLPSIDTINNTWVLGEFINSNGDTCVLHVYWLSDRSLFSVGWYKADASISDLDVRSPIG